MSKAFEDIRQDGYEEGYVKGLKEGMKKGMKKGLEKGMARGIGTLIQTCQELGIPRDVIIHKCAEVYKILWENA